MTADQRGHGVGVVIEEYTKTSVKNRAVSANKLEQEVLGKPKINKMPKRILITRASPAGPEPRVRV